MLPFFPFSPSLPPSLFTGGSSLQTPKLGAFFLSLLLPFSSPRSLFLSPLISMPVLNTAIWGMGEWCKLPQLDLGWSSSGNQIQCILSLKSDICWHQFYELSWEPIHCPGCIGPRSGWTASSLENKSAWMPSVTVHPHYCIILYMPLWEFRKWTIYDGNYKMWWLAFLWTTQHISVLPSDIRILVLHYVLLY